MIYYIGNKRLKGRVGGSEAKALTSLPEELVQAVKVQLAGKCEKPFKLSHQRKTLKGKMRLDLSLSLSTTAPGGGSCVVALKPLLVNRVRNRKDKLKTEQRRER